MNATPAFARRSAAVPVTGATAFGCSKLFSASSAALGLIAVKSERFMVFAPPLPSLPPKPQQ